MTATLADGFVEAPRLSAPGEARRRLAELIDILPAGLRPELERARTRDVLLGLADHSPYLWALIEADPARLVRLEGSRSRPGSGLGLSLAAAVARMHGGTVELEDNQPGLRVRMTLPAADERPQSLAPAVLVLNDRNAR